MSEIEPIVLRPRHSESAKGSEVFGWGSRVAGSMVSFNRHELDAIMAHYSRGVAAGDWRDYALDMGREKAVFSIFRRSSEWPLFRVEKTPKLARKQGAFSIVAAGGVILKRGHELARVLTVLNKTPRAV